MLICCAPSHITESLPLPRPGSGLVTRVTRWWNGSLVASRSASLTLACFVVLSALHLLQTWLVALFGRSTGLPLRGYANRIHYISTLSARVSTPDFLFAFFLPAFLLFIMGWLGRRYLLILAGNHGFARSLAVYFCLFAAWTPVTSVLSGLITEKQVGYIFLRMELGLPIRLMVGVVLVGLMVIVASRIEPALLLRLTIKHEEARHGGGSRFRLWHLWLPFVAASCVFVLCLQPAPPEVWLKPLLYLPVFVAATARLSNYALPFRVNTAVAYRASWRQGTAAAFMLVLLLLATVKALPTL